MNKTKNNNNNNNIVLQITLFDKDNKHKPISILIEVASLDYYREHETEIKTRAIQKICNQRYMTGKDLKKYGYTTIKVRNYTLYQEIKKKKFKKSIDK